MDIRDIIARFDGKSYDWFLILSTVSATPLIRENWTSRKKRYSVFIELIDNLSRLIYKNITTFGRERELFALWKMRTMISFSYLHCADLHWTALTFTALQFTTLHYCNCNKLHCNTVNAINCDQLHCTCIHRMSLHYTALHYTTLHCQKLHYTTMQKTALHYAELSKLVHIALHWTTQWKALTCTNPSRFQIFIIDDAGFHSLYRKERNIRCLRLM